VILTILQARMSSTRLPGKVLKPVLGEPILQFQIRRLQGAKKVDRLVLATSTHPSDDPLEDLAHQCKIDCFRGSLEDVLDRFCQCARRYQPRIVVRTTGDCPLIDPELVDQVIALHLSSGADFTANTIHRTFPDGLDTEAMSFATLERLEKLALKPDEREHVTRYVYAHPDEFRISSLEGAEDFSRLRWTLDTPQDFEFLSRIIEQVRTPHFSWKDIIPCAI